MANDGIDVTFTDLQSSINLLNALREQLLSTYIPKFDDIGNLTGAEAQNSPFGGDLVASRDELWAKHHQHWQNAYATYRHLADQLHSAAEGVQRVMDNYKTTEDRNHANAADIERLLSTPSSGTET